MDVIDGIYQVKKTLGQGMAGEVYLVEKDGKPLALKLLKGSISQVSPEEAEAHFKSEFALLKQLSHPHIAKILDYGTDPETKRQYFTSEFISGGELYSQTRDASLDTTEDYLLQALRALEYLHAHGITHFDIKPENLLIDAEKKILKMIDFGLAGFRPRGQLAGTPAYMAPEVALGNRPDHRADLYSLGVSFYECFTGMNPFRSPQLSQTLRNQERLIPPYANEKRPELSDTLANFLDLLLKKNPADRPSSAAAALRQYARLTGKEISLETEATSLSYLPNETQLIGREEPLERLLASLKTIRQGLTPSPHPYFLITGPAGMGKSRLLKEFKIKTQLEGIRTVERRGEPNLPEIVEPTCFLQDDLSPEEFRNIRIQLSTQEAPTLFVGCAAKTFSPSDGVEVIELKPFGKEHIRQYLSMLTGLEQPPEILVEELHRRTLGSPQHLTEILQELIRKGVLFDESGKWSEETLEDLGIDFSRTQASAQLENTLERDFSTLDKPAQKVLRWLSLCPRPVPGEILDQVLGQEDLSYWLIELLSQGFLIREEDHQGYQIANPYLIDYLAKTIPGPDQEKMHAGWARAYAANPRSELEKLFHQGRSGATAEAREALFELARRLERQGKFHEALDQLDLADIIAAENLEDYARFQIKYGEDLINLNRSQEAVAHFEKLAASLQERKKEPEAAAAHVSVLEKLATIFLRMHQMDKARATLEQGLKFLTKQKDLAHKNLIFKNYLGRVLLQEGKLEEAAKIFHETYGAWRELDFEARRLVQNNDLGVAFFQLGRLEQARQILEEDIKFWEKAGDDHLRARSLYTLAQTQNALKKPNQAIKIFQKCIQLCKDQKNYELLLRAYNGLGVLYHHQQDFSQAEKNYERALQIAQRTSDFLSQGHLETNLGVVLNGNGRPALAEPHLIAALRLLESLGPEGLQEKYLAATAHLELGDVQRSLRKFQSAAQHLKKAEDLIAGEEHLGKLRFPLKIHRAKLLADSGKKPEAKKIYRELQDEELTDDEKTELSQLGNYLAQERPSPVRETAVTQNFPEGGRPEARTLYQTMVGEMEYAKLLQLTKYINADTSLDFVLKNVLQYALELSQAERGLLLLLDEQGRLEVKASLNTPVNPNLSEISTRVAQQVLESGQMVETDDASNDQRFNEYQSVMILKLRSVLCLPIHSRNKTVGVLYLDNRFRPGAFDPQRFPLLQAFCDQAGIAIENARLFEHFQKTQALLENQLEQARGEAEHYHELLGETRGEFLPTKYAYDNIVARSKPMHEVFQLLDKITETNISVFINGETGTGKELIAKAIHYNNPQRNQGRFVAINCGGIPDNLIESELFGYKAGAFTGANKDKKGLFKEADGGTLFMDEVADLDLSMQVKLLRALEEGEVIPVGDTQPVSFDIRVVCASHKNIEDMVTQGKFREDLFYRLCQIRIPLPPLRERKDDIEPLVQRFIQRYADENKLKQPPKVSGALMKKFIDYEWPGNIRELENTIRVCCALAGGEELSPQHLPANFGKRKAPPAAAASEATPSQPAAAPEPKTTPTPAKRIPIDDFNFYSPDRTWEDYEKLIFAKAFSNADFKPAQAAKELGVSPATFYKRIKDFDLQSKDNPVYQDSFVVPSGKTLREFLEDIVWAAFQCAEDKAYTAIKWLGVSQGHFYNVLREAKKKYQK